MPRLHAVAAAAALVAAAATAAQATIAAPQRTSADPLLGTWDTGPVPIATFRNALLSAGYTSAQIQRFFHNFHFAKNLEFNLEFHRIGGVPFEEARGWSPAVQPKPSGDDHGPYRLLPGHRFDVRGTDPPTNTFVQTYAYSVKGSRLTLRFISLVEPGMSKAQFLADEKAYIITAAAPYRKVAP